MDHAQAPQPGFLSQSRGKRALLCSKRISSTSRCKMNSTPQGFILDSFDDDGEGESSSFAGHSQPDTSHRYGATSTSVHEPRDGGYHQYLQIRSQRRNQGPITSSYTYLDQTTDKSMADLPSAGYGGNDSSVQGNTWQPRTAETTGLYKSGNGIKCSLCAMEFRTPSDLNRHHQTIHVNNAERPYECLVPGCQAITRKWARKDKLLAHYEERHRGYVSSIPGTQVTEDIYQPQASLPQESYSTAAFSFGGPAQVSGPSDIPDLSELSIRDSSNTTFSSSQPLVGTAASRHIVSRNFYTIKEEFDPN